MYVTDMWSSELKFEIQVQCTCIINTLQISNTNNDVEIAGQCLLEIKIVFLLGQENRQIVFYCFFLTN